MWSKEETKRRRIDFFTNFGIYMKKHIPQYGEKIRWVNYRTGINSIKFKIESSGKYSRVCIDITNKDEGVREVFFEQFEEFKKLLSIKMNKLNWVKNYRIDSGIYITRIYTEINGPSINQESEWGDIYRFFEKNLIALHEFWELSKDVFKDLEN
tara:strand:- start:8239 stop:8700 length:462 start_codon:yes stop_codon:yes gene_type:complete